MNRHAWKLEGPPPDAYSRVTAPERFQPLHGVALDLLQQLEAEFDVQRTEPYPLDPDLGQVESVRPSVRLVPADPSAAPIVVAFTVFPGLLIRCGRWLVEAFPACGCDACAETVDGESQRFLELIDSVVRGQFRESIIIPWLGAARQEWEIWSPIGRRRCVSRIERARARELVRGGAQSFDWNPWPSR